MHNISRDNNFQSDLNNAISDAISDTIYKYRDMITDNNALLNAVTTAVDLWSVKYSEEHEMYIEEFK